MFSTPFNFSHSSLNIELFIIVLREEQEILKEARSGQHQLGKFDDFLGWCCHTFCYSYGVLSLSKICLQTVERVLEMSVVCITLKSSPNFHSQRVFWRGLSLLSSASVIILNTDGVFSQPCYSHLNTPIDQWKHAAI